MAHSLGPAVTVEPMVAAGVEVSVGIVCDPAFGPLLVVAAGGTLVELLADRVVACPPMSHEGAMRLLDGLRIRPLLAGWRGAPAVDIDALAGVIVAFSQMAIEIGDVLDAVEANPVIASAARRRRSRCTCSGASGRILKRGVGLLDRSGFPEELDWVEEFCKEEVEPLEFVFPYAVRSPDPKVKAYVRGLQQQIKDQGLWAIFLDEELGGPGFGQLKLGLLNEVIGRYPVGPADVRRRRPRHRQHGDARRLRHRASRRSGGWSRC